MIDPEVITTAIHTTVAERLAIIREDSGFTQTEVGAKMGLTQRSIARIETRTNDAMTVGTIFHYLQACGMRMKISFVR